MGTLKALRSSFGLEVSSDMAYAQLRKACEIPKFRLLAANLVDLYRLSGLSLSKESRANGSLSNALNWARYFLDSYFDHDDVLKLMKNFEVTTPQEGQTSISVYSALTEQAVTRFWPRIPDEHATEKDTQGAGQSYQTSGLALEPPAARYTGGGLVYEPTTRTYRDGIPRREAIRPQPEPQPKGGNGQERGQGNGKQASRTPGNTGARPKEASAEGGRGQAKKSNHVTCTKCASRQRTEDCRYYSLPAGNHQCEHCQGFHVEACTFPGHRREAKEAKTGF